MRSRINQTSGRGVSPPGRCSQVRKNHLVFAAMAASLALLLLLSGLVVLAVIGYSSQDNLFAVPLLGGGLGVTALAARHLMAALKIKC